MSFEKAQTGMTQNRRQRCWQLGIAGLVIGGAIATTTGVQAQVTPDGTLGTRVNNSTSPCNGGTCTITDGKPAGINLFHSFKDFSVPDGGRALFIYDTNSIRNIINRVTGSSRSDINGIISANGSANVFLINPNGIIFGPNAQLNIGGSFVATTANAIGFGTLGSFGPNTGNDVSLLTVNPSAFLFNQIAAQSTITNQSVLGLQVPDGQSLLLVGGDVRLDGGVVRARGGRIELGGLAGAGEVKINPNDLRLTFPDGVRRSNVALTNGAIVDVVAGNGGDIAITAQNIDISGAKSNVCAGIGTSGSSCGTPGPTLLGSSTNQAGNIVLNATGAVSISQSRIENNVNPGATGNSGNIFDAVLKRDNLFGSILIKAGSLSLSDDAVLSTSTFGNGSAGLVFVQANGGSVSFNNSRIFSNVEYGGIGDAGGILIEAGSLSLSNGAQLQTLVRQASNGQPPGQGKAGNVIIDVRDAVTITGVNSDGFPSKISSSLQPGTIGSGGSINIAAGSLSLTNGGQLDTKTSGQGDPGTIYVKAQNFVLLAGESTAIKNTVEAGAVSGGDSNSLRAISIETGSLKLTDGARLNSSTYGTGDAGIVFVQARDAVSLSDGSGILSGVATDAKGNAGGILMKVGSLSISNGSFVTTETNGRGNAGLILVGANGDVLLRGAGSGIFSSVNRGSSGQGGAIGISADRVLIRNGAQVNVNNLGSGEAGAIAVIARRLVLDNGGLLTATTRSGNGGDIDLMKVREYVALSRESDIFTAGALNAGVGSGGNIKIRTLFVIATPRKNSDIFAGTFGDNGGFIQIRAIRLFDIARRLVNNTTNDIDASGLSKSGVNGTVDINALDIDPSRALANLPNARLPQLLAEGCRPNGRPVPKDKFYITQRGGLPPNPSDRLSSGTIVQATSNDRGKPSATGGSPSAGEQANREAGENQEIPTQHSALSTEIVEAQGWVRNSNGRVFLTAQAPNVTPHSPWLKPVSCHDQP